MSKKIILHVGIHKTGTTTLQEHIRENSAKFSASGLYYAPLEEIFSDRARAHHFFAHMLAQDKILDNDINLLNAFLESIPQRTQEGQATFISSEAFYRHTVKGGTNFLHGRELYLNRLAKIFVGFNVTVVVVLRRPEDYIRSYYQEAILQAYKPSERISSFASFRRREMGRSLRYGSNINLLSKIFPKIKVMLYEDLVSEGELCRNFYEALGASVDHAPPVQSARVSLSPVQSKIKLFINSIEYPRKRKFMYLKWIRSNAVSNLIEDFYGKQEFDFWESQSALDDFRKDINPELEMVRENFFPGRDVLFSYVEKMEINPVPELDDRFKSALLQLALQSAAT